MKQYKNIDEFQSYLKSLENKEKIERSKIITKTTLPVLGINNPTLKNIAKDIYKNDFLNFLDLMIWDYYENTIINGYLINKIKDFNTFKHYLDIYSKKIDNWASCDVLKFNVKNNEESFFNLSLEYSQSNLPFVRRIGMYILFDFIKIDNYINKIFHQLDTFTYEEHYYVNMMNAWLLCECFIKQRDLTLKYLNNHKLNTFTINKAIQKCRESYRVNKEDKELLLKYHNHL
ncbi:MAG: DNA alkylation repair protein [Bacillota bacterium]|nr:DNA alkylation repair protein [Bacillota bacterium]